MAGTLNVNRASNELAGAKLYRMTTMVVLGTVLSVLVTGWMRDNVVDIGVQGGDAVYNLATAGLILASPLKAKRARLLAVGATTGAAFTVLDEFGFTGAP